MLADQELPQEKAAICTANLGSQPQGANTSKQAHLHLVGTRYTKHDEPSQVDGLSVKSLAYYFTARSFVGFLQNARQRFNRVEKTG